MSYENMQKQATRPPVLPNTPTEPGVYDGGFIGESPEAIVVYRENNGVLYCRVNDADCPVEDFCRDRQEFREKFRWGGKIDGDAVYERIANQFANERARLRERLGGDKQ